jgi:hypothetical protein
MKLLGILLLTMNCVALTCGTSYAVPPRPAPQPQASRVARNAVRDDLRGPSGVLEEGKKASPANKKGSSPPVYDQSYSRTRLTVASHAKKLSRSRQDLTSGGAGDFHEALSEKSAGVPKKGWIQSKTLGHAPPVRSPSIGGPAARSLSDVPHRGSNPAVIAGLTNAKSGTAAAINGTGLNRKP